MSLRTMSAGILRKVLPTGAQKLSIGGGSCISQLSGNPGRRSLSTHVTHEDLEWKKNKENHSIISKFDIVSFNLLAPVYKRLASKDAITGRRLRESGDDQLWRTRVSDAMDFFKREVFGEASIIAFQEYWLDDRYTALFEQEFHQYGYDFRLLQRTGSKLDAVALVVDSAVFDILGQEDVYLGTLGDRVALLLWLRHKPTGQHILVANTHLSFPHNTFDRLNQMQQMKNLTNVIDVFALKYSIENATRVILGDFNVESRSPVCDHLRKVGYYSCFEVSPPSNAGLIINSLNSAGAAEHSNDSNQRENETGSAAAGMRSVADGLQGNNSSIEKWGSADGMVVVRPVASTDDRLFSSAEYIKMAAPKSAGIDRELIETAIALGKEDLILQTDSVENSENIGRIGGGSSSSSSSSSSGIANRGISSDERSTKSESCTRQEIKYVSHRNHNKQDQGVDHIFLKPGFDPLCIIPVTPSALLMPATTPTSTTAAAVTDSAQAIHDQILLQQTQTEAAAEAEAEQNQDDQTIFTTSSQRIFIDDCKVLPKSKSSISWDTEFERISDHRPVKTTFVIGRRVMPES